MTINAWKTEYVPYTYVRYHNKPKDHIIIYPLSILHKSIAGRYRPVRVADGPIAARCRFKKIMLAGQVPCVCTLQEC